MCYKTNKTSHYISKNRNTIHRNLVVYPLCIQSTTYLKNGILKSPRFLQVLTAHRVSFGSLLFPWLDSSPIALLIASTRNADFSGLCVYPDQEITVSRLSEANHVLCYHLDLLTLFELFECLTIFDIFYSRVNSRWSSSWWPGPHPDFKLCPLGLTWDRGTVCDRLRLAFRSRFLPCDLRPSSALHDVAATVTLGRSYIANFLPKDLDFMNDIRE